MKNKTAILVIILLITSTLFACTTQPAEGEKLDDQTTGSDNVRKTISIPEFFSDMSKTLNALKDEYPSGETFIPRNGFPDAAAICFGDPKGEYAYFFFTTQDGDAEAAMNRLGDQLKCAGFLTNAGVLFPEMEEDMSFSDFFSLIDVSHFEYDTEELFTEGWLYFKYNNMDVSLNTNEINPKGGWEFTGIERVKNSAPVIIIDEEIYNQNWDMAHAVMLE